MHKALFRRFNEYDTRELRAIKFPDGNAADKALVSIGSNETLKRMPFRFADGLTFIIPEQALGLLEKLQIHFEVSPVLKMTDLNPRERAQIRLKQAL